MKVRYIIEVYEHGVLVCAAPGWTSIPMTVLSEVTPFFMKSKAVLAYGIPHHYNASGHTTHVCMAIAKTKDTARQWQEDIEVELQARITDPEERWYKGTDTGASSLAIFHALSKRFLWQPDQQGYTPSDDDDFGRCLRLVNTIPGWRQRLPEVAAKYPDTKWPAIIERWHQLESALPDERNDILRSL